MKVGILTFQDANNYGAILQAYALKETVKSVEKDTEIINYVQPYIKRNNKLFYINKNSVSDFIKSLTVNIIKLPARSVKRIKFDVFRRKFMDISYKKYNSASEITGKDIYIVGSDQIWNGKITSYDDTFFLKFCKNTEKKISYAASVGNDNISDEQRDFIKVNIDFLDHISVREYNLKTTAQKFTNKNIYHVLDPTLMADSRIWDQFIISNKTKKKYLLLYHITSNNEVKRIANFISGKLNLEVIHISDSIKKHSYRFKNVKNVGPIEYINLFYHASFIVTDSFHGTTFSIIFNKDFITVPHKTRGSRMISLLNLLELNNRMFSNCEDISNDFDYEIDYNISNDILIKEKEKSLDYLINSIMN